MNVHLREPISRRAVLRGVGACLSLPFLEAMSAARTTGSAPVRLVWFYTKSGMWMPEFTPAQTGEGDGWRLSRILEPLKEFKSEINVLSGLRHANAFKPNPVVNRHGQDEVCHLTGADLGRVPGIAAKNSISIDQVAARHLGGQTRMPTLNVSVTRGSIAYNSNGDQVPSEHRPEIVFDRLFGARTRQSRSEMERRFRRHTSILDAVAAQTRRLNARLGRDDRHKLDAYLTSVREVERRLENERRWADVEPASPPKGTKRPTGVPNSRFQHARLMGDLIALALQTDQTRIVTFKLGDMGCHYPEVDAPDGYHSYTHGATGAAAPRKSMIAVDRARIGHLAHFLKTLRAIPDGDQNLLHNSFIHYGSGMGKTHGEGELHGDIIPNLTAGRAGGRLKTDRHVDFQGAELGQLYLAMIQAAGVESDRFNDISKPLALS